MAVTSSNLEKLAGFLRRDLLNGGVALAELSKLQVAQLDNDVAKLLNRIGCFLYLNHQKKSALKIFCQSLDVLVHISDPTVAARKGEMTPEISKVAYSLRCVLLHLFRKVNEGVVAEFIGNVAVVLSNLLKAMITKKYVNAAKKAEGAKKSYKVDSVCDIKTACMLVKTNAELHVWLSRFWDAIANYEVLRKLLEQRLGKSEGDCAGQIDIEEEAVAVLQKMRLVYEDVLLDSAAASSCLRRIADHQKRLLRLKLELRQQEQVLAGDTV